MEKISQMEQLVSTNMQTVIVIMDIRLRQPDKYPQPVKCALLSLTVECRLSNFLSSLKSDIYRAIFSARLMGIHCLTIQHSET